jgi:hypothetical protein
MSTRTGIPPGENHVVVYPNKQDRDILVAQKLATLRAKYGSNISEDDLVVIKVVYDQKPVPGDV